jgi:transmembrane sensor
MSSLNQEIDRQAADWAARRDLRVLSPEEQREFDSWLAADIRHLGAYGRAEAVLARLERLHSAAIVDPVPDVSDAPALTRRRIVVAGGVAAGFAGLGAMGRVAWESLHTKKAHPEEQHPEEHFATAVGESQQVRLADGSVMTLNTSTKATVRFTDETREIHLLQGEALFDVAKNKRRPFIVTAGDTKVRAIGTSFTVSMLPAQPILVLVREGVIELQRTTMAAPVRASANVQVLAPLNAPIATVAIPEAQVERDLAWQFGKIAFDNQTLPEAAEEFARYSDVRIIVDPAVADRTVTGLFVSSDPIGFAKAAASVLKLRVHVNGREVRIYAG